MALWKTVLMRSARRLASDPEARARAAEAARRARPALDAALREAGRIYAAPDPAREAGRLAGRLKRRFLDGEDEG